MSGQSERSALNRQEGIAERPNLKFFARKCLEGGSKRYGPEWLRYGFLP